MWYIYNKDKRQEQKGEEIVFWGNSRLYYISGNILDTQLHQCKSYFIKIFVSG